MSFYARYTLLCSVPALPRVIRFRNGAVTFEVARDLSGQLPTWVFRARKLAPRGRAGAGGRSVAGRARASGSNSPGAAPLHQTRVGPAGGMPSVSPAARDAEDRALQADSVFTVCSCYYGRSGLEQMLREGITLPEDSTHARLMDALVAVGRAKKWAATRRDVR